MIDVKLLDIIQTFTIGILTITLFTFIYFISNKFFNIKNFKEQEFFTFISNDILKAKIVDSGLMYIGIIAVYILGIITCDLTERMVDTNNKKERPAFLNYLNKTCLMPDISEVRRLTLISKDTDLTPLGQAVIKSRILVENANRIFETNYFMTHDSLFPSLLARDSLVRYIQQDSSENFDKFIAAMFYQSKNWCYRKQWEPLNELKSAQIRQDLSRSIVLLVGLACQITILLFLLYCLVQIFGILKSKPSLNDSRKVEFFKNVRTTCFSLIILITLGLICKTTFQTNLLNYNKRVFGYFLSYSDTKSLYEGDRDK